MGVKSAVIAPLQHLVDGAHGDELRSCLSGRVLAVVGGESEEVEGVGFPERTINMNEDELS